MRENPGCWCFVSRATRKSERNYLPFELEALAVLYAIEKFRPYLYGTKFTLLTDHKALLNLKKTNLSANRRKNLRWLQILAEYDFDVVHIKGSENKVADALSRYPAVQHGARVLWIGSTYPTNTGYVPPHKRQNILHRYHELAGHFAVNETVSNILKHHWWPTLRRDVKDHVSSCEACQRIRPYGPRSKKGGKLHPIQNQYDSIFQCVGMDMVELRKSPSGNRYALILCDYFSKWIDIIPMKRATVLDVLGEHWHC